MAKHYSGRRTLVNAVLATIASMLLGASALAAPSATDRMAQVERELSGPVSFEGEPGWTLRERMQHYGVPGLSLAIIDDGRIVATRTYGLADRERDAAVTPDTLFQAASVSKPVAAFVAMRMAERGEISLDSPINTQLKRWQLPGNDFTAEHPVTLAQLLSHTGGTTVHGFQGYENGLPLPGLVDILEGREPANSAAVRVDFGPGSAWRYSGGGYTVAQMAMEDVSGLPFDRLARRELLAPIGMHASSLTFPPSASQRKHTAAGVMPDGADVPGRYKVHPESAAAGLWTTAPELARFAIEVQRAVAGDSELLSKASAERMLTEVRDGYALGFGLSVVGGEPWFGHNGWNDGFNTLMVADRKGHGLALMINANQPEFLEEIRRAVGHAYGWPGYRRYQRQAPAEADLVALPGRYQYNEEQIIVVERRGDGLTFSYGGEVPVPLVAVGDGNFVRSDREGRLRADAKHELGPGLSLVLDDGSSHHYLRLADDHLALREQVYAGRMETALPAYRALAASGGIVGSERYLNFQGYRLVSQERYAEAVAVFELVTRLFPESANAWDSLGEGLGRAGRRDDARRAYRRALELDPGMDTAKAALEDLRE
ncbi:serine hydrolase domain-containing protein [Arenimonas donghaensis]|uniref:Beta-lactamase-related domain-containing protein n=1 Tax=Arenimonas donghaensis DSM 18148 = HO3-R19 TaxID=1121014 RepID=A0A087MHP6_9GAMM|nr:serine hydrolase domain-containing protein [Arenimonas donghaensis]KFL36399.1 hypothetical protein N788_13220 [Arenimonas donghaensis DSM 18148 = HO3-R19]